MSKKLLSEAQVRRFQSLASIKPLQEMGSPMMDEEFLEGEYAEGHGARPMEAAHKEEMEGMHAEGEYEEGLYEEEDMDADVDADGDSDVELDEELVERFVEAARTIQEMADALGGAAGGEMDMGADEPEMGMDMGAEEPPAPAADEPAGEEEDEKEIMELALEGVDYIPSKEEVVNEVAKRVARRIKEAKEAQTRLNRALGK